MHERTDRDGVIAVLVGDNHRGLGNSADTQNRRVRLIDDGQSEYSAELARIGDGEGRAFHLFGLEFLAACALTQIADAALQAEEIQFVGILQHRNDQTPIERNRDAEIDVAMVANAFAFDRGVDDGKLLQRDDDGASKKRHEGQVARRDVFRTPDLFLLRSWTMRVKSTSNMQ